MLSTSQRKTLRNLRHRKAREASHLILVEGVRAAEDLLASSLATHWAVVSSTLEDTTRGHALLAGLYQAGVHVFAVTNAQLAEFAATDTPQGVLAVAAAPRASLEDLVVPQDGVVLVLDAVQDPGNFGTLARTAEALGAAAVVALPGTVDAWNPKAVRAAMGASFRLPIITATWDVLRPWLTERGVTLLAAAADGTPLDAVPRTARAALVLGNEGAGISDATREHADHVVGIVLRGRAESLNVAAAGAILLHELLR